jgi:pyruvate dehydrogenase E1 component alpha subunit
VPIGTQVCHVAGAAYAFLLRHEPRVAVAIFGDGGTSKGDFYEAMNMAGVWQAPLVLVVNNNQWAISVPRSRQSAAQTLAQKAIARNLPVNWRANRGAQVLSRRSPKLAELANDPRSAIREEIRRSTRYRNSRTSASNGHTNRCCACTYLMRMNAWDKA